MSNAIGYRASVTHVATAKEAQIYALVLGRVVSSLRERLGLSQAELARRVDMTQPTLSRMERGQGQPDAFTYHRLADALGVSVTELTAYVDQALARTEQATRGAIGTPSKAKGPWWQAAMAVAGLAGLAGLVAFAVAAALDETSKKKPPKK